MVGSVFSSCLLAPLKVHRIKILNRFDAIKVYPSSTSTTGAGVIPTLPTVFPFYSRVYKLYGHRYGKLPVEQILHCSTTISTYLESSISNLKSAVRESLKTTANVGLVACDYCSTVLLVVL